MKIVKREIIVFNCALFILIAFILVHVSNSISLGQTAISIAKIFEYFIENWVFLFFGMCTLFSIFYIKRFSSWLLILFNLYTLIHLLSLFFTTFDKTILLIIFIFSISSFLITQIWMIELNDPVFVSKIFSGQIGNYKKFNIPVKIKDIYGNERNGWISNLGLNSCFVTVPMTPRLKQVVSLEVNWLGKKFQCVGKILSECNNGYGIRIENTVSHMDYWSWEVLCQIAGERGYLGGAA